MALRINVQSRQDTEQSADNRQLGLQAYSDKRWLEATGYLEKALDDCPGDALLMNYLALACDNLGDCKTARSILGDAVKAAPDSAPAYRTLSILLSRDGRILEAADNACTAVELEPSNVDAVDSLRRLRTQVCSLKPSGNRKGKKQKAKQGPTQEEIDARLRRIKSVLAKAGSVPQSPTSSISLCMIVKNEERYLHDCLASVKDVVSEMVIVDTGSTDRTTEIAESFGAKVYFHPWNDSFSDARNCAIEHATGEWILVLDADERLDKDSKATVLAATEDSTADAYELLIHNYNRADSEADVFIHPTCRMYRNRTDYRYQGRVHEMIVSSIETAGGKVKRLDAALHHYGYQPEVMKQRNKHERYIRLLEADLAKDPNDVRCLYYLGAAHSSYGDLKNALKYLDQASRIVSPKQDFYAAATFYGLVGTLCSLGEPDAALSAAERAESIGVHHPQLSLCRGNALMLLKRYEEAIRWYRSALDGGQNSAYTGDRGALGYKSYYGMASAYAGMEDHAKAVEYGQKAVTEEPGHVLSHALLANSYCVLKQLDRCKTHVDRCLELDPHSVSTLMAVGRLQGAQGQVGAAVDTFVRVLELDPSHVRAYTAAADLLYASGNYAAAIKVYESYLTAAPNSPQGFIGLGNCYRQIGVHDAARVAYQQALSLDPESKEAASNLAGLAASRAA